VTVADPATLAAGIVAYAAGLDAELDLLDRLSRLSSRQREATVANDVDAIAACSDERGQIIAALLAVEEDLKPRRALLARHSAEAARLAGFDALVARHQQAARRVAAIIDSDTTTLTALRDAEAARRAAAQAIEQGEATLAAYRRIIAPAPASAAIVDERG
jgi:hypothetical protein